MPDGSATPVSRWAGLSHWRLQAPLAQPPLHPQYQVAGEGGTQPAWVSVHGESHGVRIGDAAHALVFGAAAADGFQMLKLDGITLSLALGDEATPEGRRVWVGDGRHTEWLTVQPALSTQRRGAQAAGAALLAPMTGKVLEVRVRNGDAVQAGQVLVLIESMKMEMRVAAPHAGIARDVGATVGATVERGALLVSVEATEETAS